MFTRLGILCQHVETDSVVGFIVLFGKGHGDKN